ncbi:MAG: hypothetical protein AAGG55_07895 [Pseudomonadota bacterium]
MKFRSLLTEFPLALVTSLTLAIFTPGAMSEEMSDALPDHAERAMAIEIDAEVLAIDHETREMVLALPTGEQVTTVVDEAVERLNEIEAGDLLVVTYLSALAADLREPTEEELANPWVEGADAGVNSGEGAPGAAVVMAVRAVCTIEGMNRLTGTVTVTIMDPRGKAHVIGDVAAERIESLRVGQSVVMTFTQAVAIGIEKRTDA